MADIFKEPVFKLFMKEAGEEASTLAPKDVANDLLEPLGAEFVQAIGRKFTLYRESKENKQIELPKAKK